MNMYIREIERRGKRGGRRAGQRGREGSEVMYLVMITMVKRKEGEGPNMVRTIDGRDQWDGTR